MRRGLRDRFAGLAGGLLLAGLTVGTAASLVVGYPAGEVAAQGPGATATVQFGNPNAPGADQNCNRGGQGVPPEQCANAFHKLIPGAVVIAAGGTVNFIRNNFHQVAVCAPGKQPNEVAVTGAAAGRVNDPNCPALGPAGNGGSVPHTFTQPGRYLVICNLLTHWEDNMWGWVEVR